MGSRSEFSSGRYGDHATLSAPFGTESEPGRPSSAAEGIRTRADDDLHAVAGSGGELNQVWTDLIDNAADATGIPYDVLAHIYDTGSTTEVLGDGLVS